MINYSLKSRLLYKFLIKKGVLRLFVEEVIRQKGNSRIVKEFTQGKKNVMEFLDFFNYINISLLWVETTQGHDFWRKVNDEFNMFYWRNDNMLIKG